jgi:hypothetical protein
VIGIWKVVEERQTDRQTDRQISFRFIVFVCVCMCVCGENFGAASDRVFC